MSLHPFPTHIHLRGWQVRALTEYYDLSQKNFLAFITPGGGKTIFALRLAHDLLHDGTIRSVHIVVHTDHLRAQWNEVAEQIGVPITVLTYQQIASDPSGMAVTPSMRALVVFDEIHHAADSQMWGDGVRFAFEYGHRNIASQAISLTLRVQLSYLFDFMILDPEFKRNIAPLPVSQQLERRNSARVTFPEIGLGPLISFSVEGLDVRDNQRDFGLTREAFVPSITYRPLREVALTLSLSGELNDVQIFNAATVEEAIRQNGNLERLLRFPDGTTFAVAQRLGVTWDRRDNPLSATTGTLLVGATEHVNAFPIGNQSSSAPLVSHFLKVTTRVAGYFRFTDDGLSLALSLSGGTNIQLESGSKTYPDRLFYLGGFESHRGFFPDSVIPEDVAQRILDGELTDKDVAIRGGDLVINPRVELRIPVYKVVGVGVFLDVANLYVDPAEFDPLAWRYGAGAGLRISTPLGPLAFDGAFNLDRREWEDIGAIHFSVGLF